MERTDVAARFAVVPAVPCEGSKPAASLFGLQPLSTALVNALTTEQVVDALLREGLSDFNTVCAAIYLLTEDKTLFEAARRTGAPPSRRVSPISLDAPLPLAAAARQKSPIFLDVSDGLEMYYPLTDGTSESCCEQGALAVLPLQVSDRVLGVLGVTFADSRPLPAEVRVFLETAAQMGAFALERARLQEAEHQAREDARLRQEQLEKEKKENETRALDFFGSLTDGFSAYSREWRVLYTNDVAASAVRLSREEFVGKIVWELFPEYVGSGFYAACHQVMRDHVPIHREDYWQRHDTWFENHIFPTDTGIAVLCRDITERKQAEAFQQTISDLFLNLANVTDTDAILEAVVEAVGRVLHADGCAMTGIDVEQNRMEILRVYSLGKFSLAATYRLSDMITSEWIALYQQGKTRAIADTAADASASPAYEKQYRPMQVGALIAVPFLRESQWVGTLSVMMHEARAWRPQEIAFVEAVAERAWLSLENARLFQSERERSAQLSLAISEVHHRVKNNLQAVSALLEMQINPDSLMLPVEAVEDSLSQIKTIALVHDLLARDKPIGGVNVGQVLTNLAELLSRGMRIGKQALNIRVETESLWIPTKAATSLALAVNELLTNAAKHNEIIGREGTTSDDAITISLQRKSGQVFVAVHDHGPGFPPDFDPVREAHIGLELVLMLVSHDLNGSVAFTNWTEPGEGTPGGGGRVEIIFPEQSLPD